MTCSSKKVMHVTRDAALEAMKHLVYLNHVRGQGERSAGLGVYPCEECSAWHIGHTSRRLPTVYHYDTVAALDRMTDAIALPLPTPLRIDKKFKRANTARRLAVFMAAEIREPLIWFSWNAAWDFSGVPHLGAFQAASVADRQGEGLLRFGVSAALAKLRWSDYLARNPGRFAREFARRGNPAEWLATDQPVPFNHVQSMEIWHHGAWVDVNSLPAEDIDAAFSAGI